MTLDTPLNQNALIKESSDQPSDGALLAAASHGDKDAFARLYDRHAAQVYGLALRMVRRPADADALVSDVFLELWSRPDRFDESLACCRTYLLMLTRCRAIDRMRAASVRAEKTNDAAEQQLREQLCRQACQSPSAALLMAEQREEVNHAVAQLGHEQREALSLAYFEGLTHREIAEKLDAPLGTIKTRIRSGLSRLRSLLTTKEPNNDMS